MEIVLITLIISVAAVAATYLLKAANISSGKSIKKHYNELMEIKDAQLKTTRGKLSQMHQIPKGIKDMDNNEDIITSIVNSLPHQYQTMLKPFIGAGLEYLKNNPEKAEGIKNILVEKFGQTQSGDSEKVQRTIDAV